VKKKVPRAKRRIPTTLLKSMKRVLIIRARKHSSRLHDKHLLNIDGVPLISKVIEHAIQSKSDAVLLSTNCDRIANVASEFKGAVTCIKRPDALCIEPPGRDIATNIDDFHWKMWKKLSGSNEPIMSARLFGNSLIFDDSLTDREMDELERYPEDTVISGVLASAESHPYMSLIEQGNGKYSRFVDMDIPIRTNDWPDIVMRSNGPVCYTLPDDSLPGNQKYDYDAVVRVVLVSRTDIVHIDDRNDYRDAIVMYHVHKAIDSAKEDKK
jgi:CMP-N-acetylneuraminic acid synthetase